MPLLTVNNVTKNFGGLAAVSNVDLSFEKNELVGLIGPNGAGKTTLFNLLTGVYTPSEGEILYSSQNEEISLNGKSPHKIANLGLSRTFQNIRLFKELTVMDNVLIAMTGKHPESFFTTILRLPKFYVQEKQIRQKAYDLLAMFGLEKKTETLAKNLPYGQQRRLEIVRALATDPQLLFLDEPAAGMNPQETTDLTELIYEIHEKFDLTVVLIEHDMSLVMKICERIYVLEYGRVIAHGDPATIKNDPQVIKAYLGGDL